MTKPGNPGAHTLAGMCLCGAIKYTVADEFVYAANCHCSNCRRTTGSAFKPFAGIERYKLKVTKGQDHLLVFGDENGNNTHCKRAALCSTRWCETARLFTSPWEPWSKSRPSAQPSISSSAQRQLGSRSRTIFLNSTDMGNRR